jgi:hypothetical protein
MSKHDMYFNAGQVTSESKYRRGHYKLIEVIPGEKAAAIKSESKARALQVKQLPRPCLDNCAAKTPGFLCLLLGRYRKTQTGHYRRRGHY